MACISQWNKVLVFQFLSEEFYYLNEVHRLTSKGKLKKKIKLLVYSSFVHTSSELAWKWKCYWSVMSDSCNPMGCSPPGSSVHGIIQARILEWVAISSSRRSFRPRDGTQVSCMQADSVPSEPPGKPHVFWSLGDSESTWRTGDFWAWQTWLGFPAALLPACALVSTPLRWVWASEISCERGPWRLTVFTGYFTLSAEGLRGHCMLERKRSPPTSWEIEEERTQVEKWMKEKLRCVWSDSQDLSLPSRWEVHSVPLWALWTATAGVTASGQVRFGVIAVCLSPRLDCT